MQHVTMSVWFGVKHSTVRKHRVYNIQSHNFPTSNTEALALSDELEFAAIQAIHSQLDDNDDGKVDLSESEEVYIRLTACLH